jgi:hypothetical protein
MMIVRALRCEVALVGKGNPELAVDNAEQRLTQAQAQQHHERDARALMAQPRPERVPLPPALAIPVTECRADSHTAPTS